MNESSPRSLRLRAAYLGYGGVCYVLFLATILYAIGVVGNLWGALGLTGSTWRSMDVGPDASVGYAILIDSGLLLLFALQHSGMARPAFKRRLQRYVPKALERSTYVLMASLCLDLLFWGWRPLGTMGLWTLPDGPLALASVGVSLLGWLLVFSATFMIHHFDLFGLRQTWYAFRGHRYPELQFTTPGLYKAVRHPIYLGFIIAFWATPVMTAGHALFAAVTTIYILSAIQWEEHDLIALYGDQYREYRRRVRMLI
jgi:protein-S-isoprenylcysteine O-methyltransferase Ste14